MRPGDYYLKFTPPSGYYFSPQNQGLDDSSDSDANPVTRMTEVFHVAEGMEDLTRDAGMSNQPASIHSQVWHDVDGDGIQDSGEGGVRG